jgi:hypothetical protein
MQSPQVSATTESLVERVPGLRAYLEGEVDKIWDAGVEAVGSGELDLGLFSTDELDAWPDILEAAGALERGDSSGGDEEVAEPIINAETGPRIVAQIETYLTGLLKGDRLAQLQSQLEILRTSQALPWRIRPSCACWPDLTVRMPSNEMSVDPHLLQRADGVSGRGRCRRGRSSRVASPRQEVPRFFALLLRRGSTYAPSRPELALHPAFVNSEQDHPARISTPPAIWTPFMRVPQAAHTQ